MPIISRRGRKQLIAGLAGAGVMCILMSGTFYWISSDHTERHKAEKKQYEERIYDLEAAQLNQMKTMKSAWIPVRDIPAGHRLRSGDVKEVRLPAELSPDNLPTALKEVEGRGAKIELRKGTPITLSMLYEEEMTPHDLRNRELKTIWLPSNLKLQDIVDVRIQFPTGQDYIVLSKKTIDKLSSPAMWTTLSEQEILLLSSAMVDAYLNHASLYALTYVEPQLQQKAIPTYPPNQEVLALIQSNPNIVREAEKRLEASVRTALDRDLAKMTPGRSGTRTEFGAATDGPALPPVNTWKVSGSEIGGSVPASTESSPSALSSSEPAKAYQVPGEDLGKDKTAEAEAIFSSP